MRKTELETWIIEHLSIGFRADEMLDELPATVTPKRLAAAVERVLSEMKTAARTPMALFALRYQTVYKAAFEEGAYGVALNALKEWSKLESTAEMRDNVEFEDRAISTVADVVAHISDKLAAHGRGDISSQFLYSALSGAQILLKSGVFDSDEQEEDLISRITELDLDDDDAVRRLTFEMNNYESLRVVH